MNELITVPSWDPGMTHMGLPHAGVREAGWSPEGQEPPSYRLLLDGQEAAPTMDAIHSFGRAAIAALQAHEDSPAFSVPVNADEVPDYYDIIKARRPLPACPLCPACRNLNLWHAAGH